MSAFTFKSIGEFLAREIAYVTADTAKLLGLANKYGPAAESLLTAIATAISNDEALFSQGQAVTTPSIDASIDGHNYAVTAVFTPR